MGWGTPRRRDAFGLPRKALAADRRTRKRWFLWYSQVFIITRHTNQVPPQSNHAILVVCDASRSDLTSNFGFNDLPLDC